jgi:cytochrome b-561 domain-containing protein 2
MLSKFPITIWHILSLLSLLVAGLVTNMFLDGSLFSYHPIGMSIAYVVLMSEAVCTAIDFRKKEGSERVKRISRHMFVNFGALAAAIVGFSAIYLNKVKAGKSHFTSWHGKMGLFTFISTIVVVFWGTLSFKKLGLINYFPETQHKTIKKGHRLLGMIAYFAGFATVELGFFTGAVPQGTVTQRVMQLSTIAIVIIILYMAYTGVMGHNNMNGYLKPKNQASEKDELLSIRTSKGERT